METRRESDTTEISVSELEKMLMDAVNIEDVFKSYGINIELGRSICPKCSSQEFLLLKSDKSEILDQWCCMDCELMGGDVIEFVAWMEGVDRSSAIKKLASRAGALE